LEQIVIRLFFAVMLIIVTCHSLYGQTSETNPRLKEGLSRHPEADTNKDGVLTIAEAQAFLKKNPESRQKQRGGENKPQAKIGGERHVYKKVGDVDLSLYIFAPDGHTSDAKRPTVVFFFGGGWTDGSPSQFRPQCEHLAERGMIGITVDYRVASRHSAKVEDCVEDAKSAMRWVRSNARTLGIDPDRIASGGGSAGGHLAACTAVLDEFDAKTDDLQVSAKPNAMVLFNPALSVAPDKRMSPAQLSRASSVAKRARASMAKVSPLNFASTKQPPMIMFFGTKDDLLQGAEFYKEDSEKAGNTCTLVTYDGQGHGFFNNEKYRKLTIEEMDKFLVGLGWLQRSAAR
jgi:acetyl esterase